MTDGEALLETCRRDLPAVTRACSYVAAAFVRDAGKDRIEHLRDPRLSHHPPSPQRELGLNQRLTAVADFNRY